MLGLPKNRNPRNPQTVHGSATAKTSRLHEFVFNMSTIILYDTLQPTHPLVDTVINEPLRLSAPPQHNRLLQLFYVGFPIPDRFSKREH